MYLFLGILSLLISAVAFFYAMLSTTEFGGGNYLAPLVIAIVTFVLAIVFISKRKKRDANQIAPDEITNSINEGHAGSKMRSAGIVLIVIGILVGIIYYVLPGISNTAFDIIIRSNRILATLVTGILVPFLIILGIILAIVGGKR